MLHYPVKLAGHPRCYSTKEMIQGEVSEKSYRHIAFQIEQIDFDEFEKRITRLGATIVSSRSRVEGRSKMDLDSFIILAKVAGYATGGEKQELKFDDGAVGFKFETDGYKYVDRYYGFNPFSGTEHVYDSDEVLIWKMNYYGEILRTTSNPKIVYGFLREAMASITPEYPFRGPAKMVKGNLIYVNQQEGTLDAFHGHETIYENENKIYSLHYHGGNMKRNT